MRAFALYPLNLCFLLAAFIMLKIPTAAQTKQIKKNFLFDLESYTYVDKATDIIHPVVCSCCDGIPTDPDWYEWIPVATFANFCKGCHMQRSKLEPSTPLEKVLYPAALLNQYKVDHDLLRDYVLSPKTIINENEDILVCKECLQSLKDAMAKKRSNNRSPPKKAIASARLTGDAPNVLKRLSHAELSLISAASIECQSYIFFGGCHQQIRGWHTIFKNRPAANVRNLDLLAESGLKGKIVVVLCGPFTTTQRALVMEQCGVRPQYVREAFDWLKANNYLYKDLAVPQDSEIPLPIIHQEQV